MAPRSLFKSYGDGTRQRSRVPDAEEMEQSTAAHLNEMDMNTVYFEQNLPRSVARFDSSEVLLENSIGMGEFGTVVEVAAIRLKNYIIRHRCDCPAPLLDSVDQQQMQSPPERKDSMRRASQSCIELSSLDDVELSETDLCKCQCQETDFQEQGELISRIASTIFREKTTTTSLHYNYAVKQIRKDLYPAKRVEAAKALAREQKFLQTIHHPNIIRLRGVVGRPGFDSHMMLFDKLEHSLLHKIVDWKDQQFQSSSFSFPWKSQRSDVESDILSKRLLALYDIAKAVEFLHTKW
jgi:serine/threonine protein kinase